MSDGELRKIFREHLRDFDFVAVETGATAGGVPDMNYCKGAVEGWIENKACDHWRCAVRPMQVGWIERRLRHGGRVFVAVRRDQDTLWLYHGSKIRELKSARLDAVATLGIWSGGTGCWDWQRIRQILIDK